jgi:hypothetical protein
MLFFEAYAKARWAQYPSVVALMIRASKISELEVILHLENMINTDDFRKFSNYTCSNGNFTDICPEPLNKPNNTQHGNVTQ